MRFTNQTIFFVLNYLFYEAFLLLSEGAVQFFFKIVSKLPGKNSVMFSNAADLSSACRGDFWNFYNILSMEQLRTTASKAF